MIEVGEYVRTKNQGIKRIDTIFTNRTVNKYGYETGEIDWDGKYYGIIKTTNILKSSKDIIDLIENGDILRYRINNLCATKIGEVKKYKDTRSLKVYLGVEGFGLHQIEVLEILTHEQFENVSYKV